MLGLPYALLGRARVMKRAGNTGKRTWRSLYVLCSATMLVSCQPPRSVEAETTLISADGLAFAQGSCGGCHAVGRYGDSPNPDAFPFARIVNQPGLTEATLSSWLRDAHNFPDEMEFYLEPNEVDVLVTYLLGLRDETYRPAI